MAKKTFVTISAGLEAWDADLNDDIGILSGSPFPLYEGSAPAANQNDRGLMAVNDGTAGWIMQMSDGTAYKKFGSQCSDVGALTDSVGGSQSRTLASIPDPADSPLTADALRDDLVANVLPKIRDAVSGLADFSNDLRTNMRATGEMA